MKIVINNIEWKVGVQEMPDSLFGETSVTDLTITMNTRLKNFTNIMATIIHELTHAYLFSYGFYLNSSSFNEEQVCEFMAMNANNILCYADRIFEKLYMPPIPKKIKPIENVTVGTTDKKEDSEVKANANGRKAKNSTTKLYK